MNVENVLRRLFPNASRSTIAANVKLSHAQPEPDQTPALEPPVQGKEKSVDRIVVRFSGFRVRPLDPDNFAASIKDCLDGLRHCHLLSNDTIWDIRLETEQVQVGTYAQEKTEIEIFYPVRKTRPG